jgi:hypothetical protein
MSKTPPWSEEEIDGLIARALQSRRYGDTWTDKYLREGMKKKGLSE